MSFATAERTYSGSTPRYGEKTTEYAEGYDDYDTGVATHPGSVKPTQQASLLSAPYSVIVRPGDAIDGQEEAAELLHVRSNVAWFFTAAAGSASLLLATLLPWAAIVAFLLCSLGALYAVYLLNSEHEIEYGRPFINPRYLVAALIATLAFTAEAGLLALA
ncbi:MAG: hypothetical protein IIA90_00655 [Chloroflexi bacterium]|nr:hypothetical protein [Chloroflexota bacterium]